MTDNDDLRERVADKIEEQMGPLFGSPEYLADPVKLARAQKRRRDGALMYADIALSATPIEALQQRVERLDVAGRTLQGYIEGRPQDPFYEVKNRPAEIDAALRVFRARAALGDNVG